MDFIQSLQKGKQGSHRLEKSLKIKFALKVLENH